MFLHELINKILIEVFGSEPLIQSLAYFEFIFDGQLGVNHLVDYIFNPYFICSFIYWLMIFYFLVFVFLIIPFRFFKRFLPKELKKGRGRLWESY